MVLWKVKALFKKKLTKAPAVFPVKVANQYGQCNPVFKKNIIPMPITVFTEPTRRNFKKVKFILHELSRLCARWLVVFR
jgi:hypothetical protein